MRLVVLGAPGAGKGTQARNLAKHFNIPHISTGDILRDHMKRKTSIGQSIQTLMDTGNLVPDELVIDLVEPLLYDGKYILDGFPRTIYQANVLDNFTRSQKMELDRVISVKVPDSVIVERMSGRVSCPKCGSMFHLVYHPPVKGNLCDNCGTELVQREDDKAKTVENRLKLYHELTEPIIQYYRDKGLLFEVDGVGNMEDITAEIIKALEK